MDGRGAILRVDLSTERITTEPVPPELSGKYIGGEGINTRLLWEHFLRVDPKIDPTHPDNIIIWGLGPLGATAAGAGSKSRWTFKGPAYNMYADSTSGGGFGSQMRWAGYDHMVITGRPRRPVYLWVNDDNVELRDAGRIWGKKVSQTDNAIKQELGDDRLETACIGPAGENLVTYASLTVSRYRSAARTGAGCVFGSTNLKAVAARGSKGIAVHDRRPFYEALNAELVAINKNPKFGEPINKYGTLRLVVANNVMGWNAYRNGQGGQAPEADKMSGDWYLDHMMQRSLACSPSCASACQHWHHIKGDETPLAARYAGGHGHRPGYGAVTPFGTSCDIPDLTAVAHMLELCNEYSMDCFEAGMSISFLMELWQRGIITGKGGATHEQTMRSRPVFPLLAAVAPVGCNHGHGSGVDRESSMLYFGKPDAADALTPTLKGAALVESFCSMYNSLGVCKFGGGASRNIADFPLEIYASALHALTGTETAPRELRTTGERILNIQKAFNSRLGLRREHDSLCHRWMNEPAPDGPGRGMKAADYLEQEQDEYYEFHRWDRTTSLQKRELLEELGLEDVARVLEKEGGLA